MAVFRTLQFSPPCCCPSRKFTATATATATATSIPLSQLKRNIPLPLSFSRRPIPPRRVLVRGTENESEAASEPEAATSTADQQTPADSGPAEAELSDVGEEIKKMLKERESKERNGGGFLSGVAEEIQEIEWPEFAKVLSITGVVLGVIAGSSVVLLTVNAILAELSDRAFAGRGIQDFFG